ncbi:MAG: thiamine pyrophosphate-dependent dehydrogenase E1 component subunit alpha [Firmicutes bacterium]|nr:thiamine pyrophosphate-dependent dehydrogenase E1 component subunit alpha [Bacillota bacterium]
MAVKSADKPITKHKAKGILTRMREIRAFEEQVDNFFQKGMIHGTTHLYIGEEATAVGACSVMEDKDFLTSTHRGHGHCIAKGIDMGRMMSELMGKATGYCYGKGGSMHIADVEAGNLGANGIVGGGIPIAVGAGLALKMEKRDEVVTCFFGDGAAAEGVFHESLNLASLWQLPVVFVCENNQYGMSAPLARELANPRIVEHAAAYNMPGVEVDGNDVMAVRAAVEKAVVRARKGEGPSLIVSQTYRIKGHSKSDANRYRTREEIDHWRQQDPIRRFEAYVQEQGLLTEEECRTVEAEVRGHMEQAMEYAAKAPEPDISTLTLDVYAD